MIVLLKIDCFNIEGFSSTTGIVCTVVRVNDIGRRQMQQEDSSKELGSQELILSSELSLFTSLKSYLYNCRLCTIRISYTPTARIA